MFCALARTASLAIFAGCLHSPAGSKLLVAFVLLAFCAGLGVKHWRRSPSAGSLASGGSNSVGNMQAIGFHEALDKLFKHDPRYHAEAYIFLRDALEATLKRRKKARKEHRPRGRDRVARGISDRTACRSSDRWPSPSSTIGVFAPLRMSAIWCSILSTSGIFGKTDEDTLESFREGYDFAGSIRASFPSQPEKLSANGPGIVGKKA